MWAVLRALIEPYYPKLGNGRLLEKHRLGEEIFIWIDRVLQASGMKLSCGTIIDATLIGASGLTKN